MTTESDAQTRGFRSLREAALRRLLALDAAGNLITGHVQLTAQSLTVSERTMWRWLNQARKAGQILPGGRRRFEVDDQVRRRLAYWRGNVAAVHRELADTAQAGGPPAPSVPTLYRAAARDLSPGERAGLRKGEQARRDFDVFLKRPKQHRNAVWEADHVEAPVEVDVDGRLVKPWVTWFIDTTKGLNAAAEKMFFAELPRLTHAQKLANRLVADRDAPAAANTSARRR